MRAQQDVLFHRELRKDADILESAGDAEVRDAVCRAPNQLLAKQADGANLRPEYARDQVEHGGLAGSVRTDQADDLALHDLDVELVHRGQPAEPMAQAANLEDARLPAQLGSSGPTIAPEVASTSAAATSDTAGSSDGETAVSAVSNSRVPPSVLRGRIDTVPGNPSGR